MPTVRFAAASVALICALTVASAAQASPSQLSIMMDDDLLLYRGDNVRDLTLKTMVDSGADAVRVSVLWSVVTDGIELPKKPTKRDRARVQARMKTFKRYGAASPKAYPRANWDRYDRLARACRTLKVVCYFDVTGPGPSFAHAKPPKKYRKDAKFWMPKPREFYKFVQAVGKRFSGRYHDENDAHTTLPVINFWALWNEPNQGGWLRPQWLDGEPVSPRLYRDLYSFGYRALVSTGHGGDIILAGETAPVSVTRKTTTSAMDPSTFTTALFCANGMTDAGCKTFEKGPLRLTAWAHHPYIKTERGTGGLRQPGLGEINLLNLENLGVLLDTIRAQNGHLATLRNDLPVPLMSTEFGFESNPPDPCAGVSFAAQASLNMLGEYLTFGNPRVAGHTQFLLRDVHPVAGRSPGSCGYWGTYQSGLILNDGKNTPKPALAAYKLPFLVLPGSIQHNEAGAPTAFSLWGMLRFRPNVLSPQAPDTAVLQFRPADGSADWAPIGPLQVTNNEGYFVAENVPVPGVGFVRIHWEGAQLPFMVDSLEQPVA